MTAATEVAITVAGVYDMPAEAYHADPVPGGSLSSSGARKLLQSPARFDHERRHPSESTKAMDLGTVVHQLVLGKGAGFGVVKAKDWRTNAAKDEAEAIRFSGRTPILEAQMADAEEMATALSRYPLAAALLSSGTAEQALIWCDEETGVMCRALLDYRRDRLVVDYKTTADASKHGFAKSVANFGYHQQAAWYLDGTRALGLADGPAFVFVAQEKAPPFLVGVYQLDEDSLAAGRALNRQALERYRDCTESGVWPGYSPDVEVIALPRWALRQAEETYVD